MKLLIITNYLLFSFQFSICKAQNNININLNKEKTGLKNYAFCQCLYDCNPKDSCLINDGSVSGYFQLSAYNIDVFGLLDSMALKYSKIIYPSQDNAHLSLMKCLDFYNSNELNKFVNNAGKFLKKRNKSGK